MTVVLPKKVTELDEDLTPSLDDLLFVTNDPDGAPVSKKVSIGNLIKTMGWVDVRKHGAVGDGVTDDTAAIQAAIDSGANGTIIGFPGNNSTYAIGTGGTGLVLPTDKRIWLRGAGWRGCTLKALANCTMISLPSSAGQNFIEISGFVLNGNNNVGTIIDINGNSFTNTHDVRFANMTTGVDLTDTGANFTKIWNNTFSTLTNGILFDNACNATRILNNDFFGAMAYGIKSNATFVGDDILIQGNTFGCSSPTNNILLQTTSGFQGIMAKIINNRFDNANSNSDVNIGRYMSGIVENNSFASASPSHIICDGYEVTIGKNYHATSTGPAISLTSNSNRCVVYKSRFGTGGEVCSSKYSDVGTANIFDLNSGYGISSAIATGATIAHGLGVAPDIIHITAAESGPTDIYASADATNITVNFGGGGNKIFYWFAGVKP
uniref:Putative pectate lyase n=1 Tax=viral metagenome TaxID=1070528 RepID=A0A6M3JVV3_9ZZZZ